MTPAEIVEAQLGRPLRSVVLVVKRCPLDLPVVIRVPPVLDDGTPFPTMYWLTCPLAQKRIGRLEGLGGVKQLERYAEHDKAFGAALAEAHHRYAAERDSKLPGDAVHTPSGGVGGTRVGIKCIHAHYADSAAGNENPVGEVATPFVEPLDCDRPCVVEVDGAAALNPRWREPR
jgi:hypothetical protein